MKELIGRRIDAISIDADEQHYLRFKTDTGDVTYFADGDCCSESWFYHILGVNALLGHTVIEVTEIDMDAPDDGLSRQDVDQLYGINIKTTGGMADIEFRNSSNGYYGGELLHIDDAFYRHKYYRDELSKVRFVPVLTDYTAQSLAVAQ